MRQGLGLELELELFNAKAIFGGYTTVSIRLNAVLRGETNALPRWKNWRLLRRGQREKKAKKILLFVVVNIFLIQICLKILGDFFFFSFPILSA